MIAARRCMVAEKEGKATAEAEVRTESTRIDDEDERVVTIKLDLRGPMEMLSWMNPFNVRSRLMAVLPSGAREHVAAAQREQLLAFRSIVDSMLDTMIERTEHAATKSERRARKIDVE